MLHSVFLSVLFQAIVSEQQSKDPERNRVLTTHEATCKYASLSHHYLNNLPHCSVILFFRPLCTRVKIRILRCADVFLHMKLCAGAKIKLSQIWNKKKILKILDFGDGLLVLFSLIYYSMYLILYLFSAYLGTLIV